MKSLITLLFALFLAGCATVDFQPYEGKNNRFEGDGGAKVTVDGIDFWSDGSPPKKFIVLGIVVSETGAGWAMR